MLQRVHVTASGRVATCQMILRCGNCRRVVRPSFVIPRGSEEVMQRSLDEGGLEIWAAFACEGCDYDRAYVLAIGIEPTEGEQ